MRLSGYAANRRIFVASRIALVQSIFNKIYLFLYSCTCLRGEQRFRSWDRRHHRLCLRCRTVLKTQPSDEDRYGTPSRRRLTSDDSAAAGGAAALADVADLYVRCWP
jgi:hypothetical protein